MGENGMLSAIEPTTPVGIAAPVILWSKARPLFELHAQALAGDDADAVHDIRLAARRTREALEIFEPLYEPEEYDWMSQIVRQITRALGPIRDADASIEEFAHLVEQLHAEDTRAALAYLIGYAAGDRAVRVQAMKGRLRLLNLAEKRQRFELGLHGFKRNADVATTLQSYAATVIPERLEAVLAHLPAALVRESTAEQQQMRTDIRHLRHAAETFRPVFGAEYNAIHRLLTEMQDVLATLADRDVFIGLVRAAESQPEASTARVSTVALEEVIRALDAERDAYFRQFRTIMEEHRPLALRARLFSAAGIEGYAMPAVELEVPGAEAAVPEVTSRPQPTERIPVIGAPGAEAAQPAEVAPQPERTPAFTPASAVPAAPKAVEMPAEEAAAEAPSAVEALSATEPPSPAETPTPSWPPADTARPEALPPAAAAVPFGGESLGTAETAPTEAVSAPAETLPAETPPTEAVEHATPVVEPPMPAAAAVTDKREQPAKPLTSAGARREILAQKLKAAREMSTTTQKPPVIGETAPGEAEAAEAGEQPTLEAATGELTETTPSAETTPVEASLTEAEATEGETPEGETTETAMPQPQGAASPSTEAEAAAAAVEAPASPERKRGLFGAFRRSSAKPAGEEALPGEEQVPVEAKAAPVEAEPSGIQSETVLAEEPNSTEPLPSEPGPAPAESEATPSAEQADEPRPPEPTESVSADEDSTPEPAKTAPRTWWKRS